MTSMALAALASIIIDAKTTEADISLVDLAEAVPGSVCTARYAGPNNFVGRPLPGYEAPVCLGTAELAEGLKKAQQALDAYGMSLVIFDAYRPQTTVNFFVEWTADAKDTSEKKTYYPEVAKSSLIPDGYIADKSGHSRGSTVDLSVIDNETGDELDMGTPFDFFSPRSGTDAKDLDAHQRANRLLLRSVMEQAGFAHYWAEWWHFRLKDEPYPDTYFDQPVKR